MQFEKTYTFFPVIIPGLESMAQREIQEKLEGLSVEYLETGEFVAPLAACLDRFPSFRSLSGLYIRIAQFKCRDRPKLFKKIAKENWNYWLQARMPEVVVTSKESRLIHTGKIQETILEGLKKSFLAFPLGKKDRPKGDSKPAKLSVRFYRDICTVSLDLAGFPLHQRGLKKQIGRAPMRETQAYCLIKKMVEKNNVPILVDPFAGSGTIILEAMELPNETKYYFENFYQPKELAQKKEFNFKKFLAIEKDQNIFSQLENNLAPIKNSGLISCQDSYQFDFNSIEDDFIVLSNPPWGERIKTQQKISRIVKNLKSHPRCRGIGFLYPMDFDLKGLGFSKALQFTHGGKKVSLWLYYPN